MSLFTKIIAFFSAIIAFFSGLISGGKAPAVTPDPPAAQTEYFDLAYGDADRQTLDLVLPGKTNGEAGLVLYIHGGAWITGNKDAYRASLRQAAAMGYAAAAINYRYVSAEVTMDMLMDDVSAALSAIRLIGARQNLAIKKVLLTGTSAGAHMSLLYAYKHAADAPITPAAVVSYCGPSDLTDRAYLEENQLGDLNWMLALSNAITGIQITAEEYKNKTGNYAEWEEALQSYSPVNFVSPACPPTVIAHGAEDTVVPFSTAQTLEKALTDNGVKHDFVVFPHSGHGLDADPDVYEKTIDLLIQYAAAYLK